MPLVMLFFSVFNELDFNYLKLDYFSFNFVYLLIFFWTLRNPNHLGYLPIFFAGIINDVVVGIPIGISSFCYLLLCSVTAYIRNITLSPNFINDWISLLFTILLINSIQVIILDLIFLIKIDYMSYLINSGFTFIFYPVFFIIFNFLNMQISKQPND
jgi:rod shape-determining protein MreD